MGFLEERALMEVLRESGLSFESMDEAVSADRGRLAASVWSHYLPHAAPVGLKLTLILMLGERWAVDVALPGLIDEYRRIVGPFMESEERVREQREFLASSICKASNRVLWPHIQSLALAPESEEVRAHFVTRLGGFKQHSDEVLATLDQISSSEQLSVHVALAEALRKLGDPRGMAILHKVKDLGPAVLRSKAAAWERLSGR
jgi:hypothetical protein